MVTKDLEDAIRAGKVTGKITAAESIKIKEEQEQELSDAFAPFSEWISRGAMSHTQLYPNMKEVSRPISKGCRAIMSIARNENKNPSDCIDAGCKAAGVDVSDLIEALESIKKSLSESHKPRSKFKGRGKTEKPSCPECGQDLRRSYEIKECSTAKRPYGWHCRKCQVQVWDTPSELPAIF